MATTIDTPSILKGVASSIVSVAALCGALWVFGEPHLEKYVDGRIQSDKANRGKSFRSVLGEKIGVPADEVPIVIGAMYNGLGILQSNIDTFITVYMPLIADMSKKDIPYMYIEHGVEYWVIGGREYEVTRNEESRAFYIKQGQWKPIP